MVYISKHTTATLEVRVVVTTCCKQYFCFILVTQNCWLGFWPMKAFDEHLYKTLSNIQCKHIRLRDKQAELCPDFKSVRLIKPLYSSMGRVGSENYHQLVWFCSSIGCSSGFSTWRRVSVVVSGQNQMRSHGCTVSSTSPPGQSLTRLAWFEHGASTQQLVVFIVFPKVSSNCWPGGCVFIQGVSAKHQEWRSSKGWSSNWRQEDFSHLHFGPPCCGPGHLAEYCQWVWFRGCLDLNLKYVNCLYRPVVSKVFGTHLDFEEIVLVLVFIPVVWCCSFEILVCAGFEAHLSLMIACLASGTFLGILSRGGTHPVVRHGMNAAKSPRRAVCSCSIWFGASTRRRPELWTKVSWKRRPRSVHWLAPLFQIRLVWLFTGVLIWNL